MQLQNDLDKDNAKALKGPTAVALPALLPSSYMLQMSRHVEDDRSTSCQLLQFPIYAV